MPGRQADQEAPAGVAVQVDPGQVDPGQVDPGTAIGDHYPWTPFWPASRWPPGLLRYGITAWTSQTAASRCTPSASAYGVSAARSDAIARSAVAASAPASMVRPIVAVRRNSTASSTLPPPPTRIGACSEVISMSCQPT